MTSHFAAIGLPAHDAESFGALCETMFPAAMEDAPPVAARHLLWLDRSGAAVAFHVDGDAQLQCVTPFFAPPEGLTRWRVRTSGPRRDPECLHCGGIDCDLLDDRGEPISRAAVQLLHFAPWEEWLKQPRTFELEVAAFASAPRFYATRAELDEAAPWAVEGEEPPRPDAQPLSFADNAFIPVGQFGAEPFGERAVALLMGRVERVSRRHVGFTDTDYLHVRLAALPGAVDVVAAVDDVARAPAVGDLTFTYAWLVGRPVGAPPEEKRSFWSWLRGG